MTSFDAAKDIRVYYRISDKGNPKEKLPRAGKIECLKAAVAEFGAGSVFVIADNCLDETVRRVKELGLRLVETSLGNSRSFMLMLDVILAECLDDQPVYLLEDDYVHLSGSKTLLLEGLAIADYVTLYDHPDKYLTAKSGGSPLNRRGLRPVRVFATAHSHWRETDSTTMTFAARVATLREDYATWARRTTGRIPDDFRGFTDLTRTTAADAVALLQAGKKRDFFRLLMKRLRARPARLLVSALPARATHAELRWLAPVVLWDR